MITLDKLHSVFDKYVKGPEIYVDFEGMLNELNNQQTCETCELEPYCRKEMIIREHGCDLICVDVAENVDYCSLYKQKEQS